MLEQTLRALGFINTCKYYLSKKPYGDEVELHVLGVKKAIFLRPGTTDIRVFKQIFITKDYEFSYPIVPKTIIDCGANIGCSTVYFLEKFPEAQVIAIEPEQENFLLLQKNTSLYKNINLYKAGLWHEECYLRVRDVGEGNWSFTVEKTDFPTDDDLHAITIEKIIKEAKFDTIDILKMDIEGAEREVFSAECSWLAKVNILIIEIHDKLKPGCSAAFFKVASDYDFATYTLGENLILIKRNLLK